jgi:hypothetical protein
MPVGIDDRVVQPASDLAGTRRVVLIHEGGPRSYPIAESLFLFNSMILEGIVGLKWIKNRRKLFPGNWGRTEVLA